MRGGGAWFLFLHICFKLERESHHGALLATRATLKILCVAFLCWGFEVELRGNCVGTSRIHNTPQAHLTIMRFSDNLEWQSFSVPFLPLKLSDTSSMRLQPGRTHGALRCRGHHQVQCILALSVQLKKGHLSQPKFIIHTLVPFLKDILVRFIDNM